MARLRIWERGAGLETTVERIGFVGAGRAGTALARAFAAAGWPVVAIASRTPASAARLAARLPAAIAVPSGEHVAAHADLVFLTVPDAAIAPVAGAIPWTPDHAVVHTSGADSLEPLAAARRAGARVGAFHPLQTFAAPSPDPLAPFAGVTCAVEADAALLPRLEALAVVVGARPLGLPPEARALYHASAAIASNYLVTLIHLAADLWRTFGVPEAEATAALLPLIRGAVANVAAHGAAGPALTGPIARGDAATVERHLRALATARPELLDAYRALAHATVALARAQAHLAPEAADAVRQTLDTIAESRPCAARRVAASPPTSVPEAG